MTPEREAKIRELSTVADEARRHLVYLAQMNVPSESAARIRQSQEYSLAQARSWDAERALEAEMYPK